MTVLIFSMNPIVDYYTSKAGIVKLLCIVINALLVALSTHSHFNSHWTLHARIVEHEEVTHVNKRKLQQLENEFEECRYNTRFYSGINTAQDHNIGSVIDEISARREFSTAKKEKTCPNPILELFLVSVSISILIMCIFSQLIICGILPRLVTADSLGTLRVVDMSFFALSSLFLLIGTALFWYSTHHIAAWCELKSGVLIFKQNMNHLLPVVPSNEARVRHHETVDIIEEEVISTSTVKDSSNLILPTEGPHNVYYLTRVKRDADDHEVDYHLRLLPDLDSDSGLDLEIQRLREDQYLDLCYTRQLIFEKYVCIAVGFLSVLLHVIAVGCIFKRWRTASVLDATIADAIQSRQPVSGERRSSSQSGRSGSHESHDPETSSREADIRPIIKDRNRLSVPKDKPRVSFESKGVGDDEV